MRVTQIKYFSHSLIHSLLQMKPVLHTSLRVKCFLFLKALKLPFYISLDISQSVFFFPPELPNPPQNIEVLLIEEDSREGFLRHAIVTRRNAVSHTHVIVSEPDPWKIEKSVLNNFSRQQIPLVFSLLELYSRVAICISNKRA